MVVSGPALAPVPAPVTVPVTLPAVAAPVLGTPMEKFHNAAQLIAMLISIPPSEILENVPKGNKSNVYMYIDNKNNMELRAQDKNSVYIDDCGSWKADSTSTTYHFRGSTSDNYKEIWFRPEQRVYANCTMRLDKTSEKKTKRIREYTILKEQPSPDTVIKLTRYYSHNVHNTLYKRHISWLGEGQAVALVEYGIKHPVVITKKKVNN